MPTLAASTASRVGEDGAGGTAPPPNSPARANAASVTPGGGSSATGGTAAPSTPARASSASVGIIRSFPMWGRLARGRRLRRLDRGKQINLDPVKSVVLGGEVLEMRTDRCALIAHPIERILQAAARSILFAFGGLLFGHSCLPWLAL